MWLQNYMDKSKTDVQISYKFAEMKTGEETVRGAGRKKCTYKNTQTRAHSVNAHLERKITIT